MLGSCSFESGEGVGIRAELKSNKIDIPVLRRDLNRIELGRMAWNRAQEHSIRAALVPGRGASTIWKTMPGIAWEMLSGTSIFCSRSLPFCQASIERSDEPYLLLLRALIQKLTPNGLI
eukprot:1150789-Pelagomonas_calceolata.AAC.2